MEENFEKEIYQLSDYIFQLFKDSNAEVDDALYIMSAACDHVMRTLCVPDLRRWLRLTYSHG